MPKPKTPAPSKTRFVWRKLSQAKWDDVWQERLGWLRDRLVLINFSGKTTTRIEAYDLSKAESDELVKEFGGQLKVAKPMTAKDIEPVQRPPLRVRNRLLVVSSEKELRAAEKSDPKIPRLLIPASLAFGTGEHATTATCLRLLADTTKSLTPGSWDALDLGTGSGILGFASRLFGARKVDAADFDATAIRIAKENAVANKITGITFKRFNVLEWTPKRQWPLVTANLYSPILIAAAKQIAAAVQPGGTLILSGILRIQSNEVIAAFKKQRCKFEIISKKGKWVTCLAKR